MPAEEEIKSQQELITAHRRTLAVLLKQEALHSALHAPPDIVNGIQMAREDIQRIKSNLRALGIAIEDQPEDEESPSTQPGSVARSYPTTPAITTSWRITVYIGAFVLLAALGIVVLLMVRNGSLPQNSSSPTPDKSSRPTRVSIRATVNGVSTDQDISVAAGTIVTFTAAADAPLREIYNLTIAANAPYPFSVIHSCNDGLECSVSVAKAGQTLTYSGYLGDIGGRILAHSERGITVTWLP
jgi:hypothetical protein